MHNYTFEERAPHEEGFEQVYADRVAPVLAARSGERAIIQRRARWRAIAIAVLGIAGIAAISVAGPSDQELRFALMAFAALVTAIGSAAGYLLAGSAFDEALAETIGPILCDFMGDAAYRRRPGEDFLPVRPLVKLRVVPPYTSAGLQDGVDGVWRGVRYKIVEATLRRKSTSSAGRSKTRETVFSGLLLEIETPKEMPTIQFRRELSWVSDLFGSGATELVRLELPDPEFESVYRVYTDDPEAARVAIGQGFGQTLLDLAEAHVGGRGHVAAAFQGRSFYLALPKQDGFMPLGGYDVPPERYAEQCRRALGDLTIPRRVIDRLLDGA